MITKVEDPFFTKKFSYTTTTQEGTIKSYQVDKYIDIRQVDKYIDIRQVDNTLI